MDSPTQVQDSDGILEIDTLKQFTIPKRKKAKKDLFENLTLDSREYVQDILHVIKLSYKDRESARHFSYTRPRLIHCDQILNEYAEKKKRMRQEGYLEKELQDFYGFLYVETEQEVRKICRDGLRTGNCAISCLGNPKMGVYLCKHADIITAEPLKARQTGMLLLLKVIKGKVKFMVENRSGTPLEPSPNFDCHLLKTSNIDMSAASPQYVYECTQLYVYEYKDDSELSDRPRQIYPFAVVDFHFQGLSNRDASRLGPPILQQQMKSQTTAKKLSKKPWSGKDIPVPPLLEPLELKKARQKTGDLSGAKNPPQLSPSMPKGDTKRSGATVEKESSNSGSLVLMRDAVIWSGELYCDGVSVSQVQLLSLSLPFKPSGLRKSLNIEKKIPLVSIQSRFFQSLKSLDYKTEREIDGVYYFCASLSPVAPGIQAFKKFVDYLVTSETGLVIGIRKDAHIVMLPDCDLSQDLGLSRDSSDSCGLHCVILMKTLQSDWLKGEVEKMLQLPETVESHATPIDVTSGRNPDEERTRSSASVTGASTPSDSVASGEATMEADAEQPSSESSQSRDPRLRRKPASQAKALKPSEVARKKPSVVSHSRLVTVFEEMSKLQDRSNIELARMMKMNRHIGTSGSQPSPNESAHPAGVPMRKEPSEVFPRRSPAQVPSPGMASGPGMPLPQAPHRPLLYPSDQGGPRGSGRPQMPTDGVGFSNPWGRRWPPGNVPQQGPPTRQNQFPSSSSNGMFAGWNPQFAEPLYPPGPDFKPKEMLSPRAWEELRKKGKGQDMGQVLSEQRPSGPPAEVSGRRISDPRSSGLPGLDQGQRIPDQYAGYPGNYGSQDPGTGLPVDPRPGGHYAEYGSYDPNRWMADPRTAGHPGENAGHEGNWRTTDPRTGTHLSEQQSHDFNRWPSDPRQAAVSGEYPGHNSDWWVADQGPHGDWPNQNAGFPAFESRPGLLGDYPNQDLNHQHRLAESRPSEMLGEQQNRNVNRFADPRISRLGQDTANPRWPIDPRTLRPPRNSAVLESNQSGDDQCRNNHSSGKLVADASSELSQEPFDAGFQEASSA